MIIDRGLSSGQRRQINRLVARAPLAKDNQRGSRWRGTPGGRRYLAIGGGDTPTHTAADIVDFVHAAMNDTLRTFAECVDFYLSALASHDIIVTPTELTISLRL